MMAARIRLALSVIAFVGWLGYLGYLVAGRSPDTLVLSRPQFLVSDIDVVATVKKGSDLVTIQDVLYANDDEAKGLKGKEIKVINLNDCRMPSEPRADLTADGDYLLPLQDPGPGGKEYRVAVTPPSPGFMQGTPRIYPATHEVLSQYRQIPKK
jgi:hypothetical protein